MAFTRLIRKKLYELVGFLRSYKVHTSEFAIHSGGRKVRVDNKTIYAFRTDLPVHISKLLVHVSACLIWCSYFMKKTAIFNPTEFLNFYFYFLKSTMIQIRKWPTIRE